MKTPTVIYRAYDADGQLLYIGIADDWLNRLQEHRRHPWFQLARRIELEPQPDRRTALVREAQLIGRLDPPYNQTAWHARDERIIALRTAGWTNAEIVRELGMSVQMFNRARRRLLAQGRIQRQQAGRGDGGRRRWQTNS